MDTLDKAVDESASPISGQPEPQAVDSPETTPETIEPEESLLEVPPVITARETVTRMAMETLAAAREREKGILEDNNPEHLHAYRVNLRRLRSLLGSIKDVYPEETVHNWKAWLGLAARETNKHRDLDVYLLSRKEMTELLPEPLQKGLRGFFSSVKRERRSVHRRLAHFLQSSDYATAMERLATELAAADTLPESETSAHPIEIEAAKRILRRLKQLQKGIKEIRRDSPDDELHEIRIIGKKVRYLLDFFGPLFPGKPITALGKQLAKLQKKLGAFNDTSVQQAYLVHYAQQHTTPLAPEQALSLGGLITAQHHEHLRLRREICKALGKFAQESSLRRFRKQLQAVIAPPVSVEAASTADASSIHESAAH